MRLPPFARQLNPDCREIWIFIGGDCWTAAKFRAARKLPVLCLPPDEDPATYRWPVAGKEVLMFQQGAYDIPKIPEFANLLFGYGAKIIRCVYGENPTRIVFYRRTKNADAA